LKFTWISYIFSHTTNKYRDLFSVRGTALEDSVIEELLNYFAYIFTEEFEY